MSFPHIVCAGDGGVPSDITDVDAIGLTKRHGALLLRGYPIHTASDFSRVSSAWGNPALVSLACSAGPRIDLGGGVFTANEAPPDECIPIHHEMAQCAHPPAYVLFHCQTPPASGGCTPIIQSARVARELTLKYPTVVKRIRRHGLRYVRIHPPVTDHSSPLGKSWREVYNVHTREEAEAALAAEGTAWQWLEDGDHLRTVGPVLYPITYDPHTDTETLFIAAETSFLGTPDRRASKAVIDGDGDTLHPETKAAFEYIGDYARRESARIPWKEGDVLILDNSRVMHARDTFTPPRRILVSLLGRIDNPAHRQS